MDDLNKLNSEKESKCDRRITVLTLERTCSKNNKRKSSWTLLRDDGGLSSGLKALGSIMKEMTWIG